MQSINIFELWQSLQSEVNVQQGGSIRPQTDFQNWCNALSKEFLHKKVTNQGLLQMNADELMPFLKVVNVPVTQVTGQNYGLIQLPNDYAYFANITINRPKEIPKSNPFVFANTNAPIVTATGECEPFVDPDYAAMAAKYANSKVVEKIIYTVDTQRWPRALSHPTKGPTYDVPMCTQDSEGLKIAPTGLTRVILYYYRMPVDCVFSYTIGDGDIVIYDPTTSVQLEWTNGMFNEFIQGLKAKYGLYINDELTIQVAQNERKNL